AAHAVLDCNLQAASVGAREQLWFVLVAAAPDRANCVNHVSRSEVTTGGDDCVADRTTSDAPTLLVNARAALGVNRAISACALIEPPVSGGDDRISVLFGDVPGDEPQRRLSDFGLHWHGRDAPIIPAQQRRPR